VATAEDRRKLFYFQYDEFYTAENVYNDAFDQLHDAISNLVKTESSACNDSIDSISRQNEIVVKTAVYCTSDIFR